MMMSVLLTVRLSLSRCLTIVKQYWFLVLLQLVVFIVFYLFYAVLPVHADYNRQDFDNPLGYCQVNYLTNDATVTSTKDVRYNYSRIIISDYSHRQLKALQVPAAIRPAILNRWSGLSYSTGPLAFSTYGSGSVRIKFSLAIHVTQTLNQLTFLTAESSSKDGWSYNVLSSTKNWHESFIMVTDQSGGSSATQSWRMFDFDFQVPWDSATSMAAIVIDLASSADTQSFDSVDLMYLSGFTLYQYGSAPVGEDEISQIIDDQTDNIGTRIDNAVDRILNADVDTSGVDIPGLNDWKNQESSLRDLTAGGLQQAEQLQSADNYVSLLAQLPGAFLWCQTFFDNLAASNPKIYLIVQLAGGIALIAVLFSLVGTFIRRR